MSQEQMQSEGISQETQEKLDAILTAILSNEISVQQALDIKEEQLEAMYFVAYNLFTNGKYQDALDAFVVLQHIAPLNYKMHFGAASCMQMLEKYLEASFVFTFSSSLEPENPAPLLHLAECYMMLGDRDAVKAALKFALERCDTCQDAPLAEAVRARATVMLENMED